MRYLAREPCSPFDLSHAAILPHPNARLSMQSVNILASLNASDEEEDDEALFGDPPSVKRSRGSEGSGVEASARGQVYGSTTAIGAAWAAG